MPLMPNLKVKECLMLIVDREFSELVKIIQRKKGV